jgi:phosphohistidine phosphatase
MGTFLSGQGPIPDNIISSTATRAKETVVGLLETLSIEGEVFYTHDLYHADVDNMLEQLLTLPDEIEVVMLVGHNPGMNEFLDMICDEQDHMPTAAIAEIEFDIAHWHELSEQTPAELKNLWKPKEIQI